MTIDFDGRMEEVSEIPSEIIVASSNATRLTRHCPILFV